MLTFPDTRVTCRASGGCGTCPRSSSNRRVLRRRCATHAQCADILGGKDFGGFCRLRRSWRLPQRYSYPRSHLLGGSAFSCWKRGRARGCATANRQRLRVPPDDDGCSTRAGGIRLGAKSSSSSPSSSSSASRADAVFVLFSLLHSKATLSTASPEDLALRNEMIVSNAGALPGECRADSHAVLLGGDPEIKIDGIGGHEVAAPATPS